MTFRNIMIIISYVIMCWALVMVTINTILLLKEDFKNKRK